jgi:hypothetical protein
MSTATKNLPPPLIVTTPGQSFQTTFQLVFKVTGQVYRFPSFRIQPGMVVILSPINGGSVNAHPCGVADRASLVGTSSGSILPAAADVSLPWLTDDTGKIFASGQSGDGILLTISEPGFG